MPLTLGKQNLAIFGPIREGGVRSVASFWCSTIWPRSWCCSVVFETAAAQAESACSGGTTYQHEGSLRPLQGGRACRGPRFGDCFGGKLLPEYTTSLGCMTAVVLPTSPAELATKTFTKPRSTTCSATLYTAYIDHSFSRF